MEKLVLVGIHGLANKPDKQTHGEYWRRAVLEGLAKSLGLQDPKIDFRFVYWADRLYKNSMHRDADYSFDDLYDDEPYFEVQKEELRPHDDRLLDVAIGFAGSLAGEALGGIAEAVGLEGVALRTQKLRDLRYYYDSNTRVRISDNQTAPTRSTLMGIVENELLLHIEAKRKLVVVGHSMGSIIAYDVLRKIGKEKPDAEVAHFVTIGSPLGLRLVKQRVYSENRDHDAQSPVRTPSIVTQSWTNFADRRDPVCFDTHLYDDYGFNKCGVRVRDDVVDNDYGRTHPSKNFHKAYGYLRTPEVSALLKPLV